MLDARRRPNAPPTRPQSVATRDSEPQLQPVKQESVLRAVPPSVADVDDRPQRRSLEFWSWPAFAVAATYFGSLGYLYTRPGGRGPILVYTAWRPLLELLALVVLAFAAVWCGLNRPFLQRRRLWPFLALVAVIGFAQVRFPYPSSHEGHESAVCFRLPFAIGGEGEWTVFWGGETKDENRLAEFSADRRWGIDLVIVDQGKSHRANGLAPKDYLVYGREVLAPADGTVARVQSGVTESRPGVYDSRVPELGNFVVLKVAEGEFLFVSHLLDGSIPVHEGEVVHAGDLLGKVGNSGYSTATPEPHLALHLQDTVEAGEGEPIPWRFCDYVADGTRIDRGLPRGGVDAEGNLNGQRVRPRMPTDR